MRILALGCMAIGLIAGLFLINLTGVEIVSNSWFWVSWAFGTVVCTWIYLGIWLPERSEKYFPGQKPKIGVEDVVRGAFVRSFGR